MCLWQSGSADYDMRVVPERGEDIGLGRFRLGVLHKDVARCGERFRRGCMDRAGEIRIAKRLAQLAPRLLAGYRGDQREIGILRDCARELRTGPVRRPCQARPYRARAPSDDCRGWIVPQGLLRTNRTLMNCRPTRDALRDRNDPTPCATRPSR